MDKQKPNVGGFTVKLGHPVLIFFWSTWMLLLGCAIGMHWRRSHTVAFCVSMTCAVMIVVHEMIDGFVWCTLTAWWLGKCQGQRNR